MKKISILALLSLIITSCNSQKSEKTFEWKNIEVEISNTEKRKLLSQVDDSIVKGFDKMAEETASDEIYDSFHVFDINKDKENDIIFNGFGGAADEFVMVFIKLDRVYVKALHVYGHIEKIEMDKPKTEIVIYKSSKVGEVNSDTTSFYQINGQKMINVKNQVGKI